MTGAALARFSWGMFELYRRQKIVMTIEAQRFTGQFHEKLVRRGMRIMAGKTFAVGHRQMPGLALGQEVVMAFGAEGFAHTRNHFGIWGPMRGMAGRTLAIFHRHMMRRGFAKKLLEGCMAGQTNL